MSRFTDFTRPNEETPNDLGNMADLSGVYMTLYRPTMTGNPGFDTEVGSNAVVARILVQLAKKNSAPARARAAGGIEVSKTYYIGMTAYKDVRRGDVLVGRNRYRVYDVDRSNQYQTSFEMERME